MRVGIVGVQGGGKSTLLQALTGVKSPASGRMEANIGVAEVPDDRINLVAQVYSSRKITHSTVEYIDAPPFDLDNLRNESFRANFTKGLESIQTLIMVIPCFIPGQLEEAAELIQNIDTELILSDLMIVENRLERIKRDLQRGVKGDLAVEGELLESCRQLLEREQPLRTVDFSEEQEKRLRSFAFLTMHPMLTVLNIDEDNIINADQITAKVISKLSGARIITAICCSVEAEIAELPPEEQMEFMRELAIEEAARGKIIRLTRETLNLQTFFTGSEKEAHAWDIKKGTTALKAAGVIHSDMEKGFIRAEVIHYDDFRKHPSIPELRSAGLIHLEGKDYVVQDGDVILFRFNV